VHKVDTLILLFEQEFQANGLFVKSLSSPTAVFASLSGPLLFTQ